MTDREVLDLIVLYRVAFGKMPREGCIRLLALVCGARLARAGVRLLDWKNVGTSG